MNMLWRVDDHTVTMSCIAVEAQRFLETHEWELVPPEDAKRITEAYPSAPKIMLGPEDFPDATHG